MTLADKLFSIFFILIGCALIVVGLKHNHLINQVESLQTFKLDGEQYQCALTPGQLEVNQIERMLNDAIKRRDGNSGGK